MTNMMKLTFLGTSAGVPTKYRNVTGLAVSLHNAHHNAKHKAWVLIDCGEATQHQLLKTSLSVMQLAMICITHVHGDHCYGLPGLLASMAMNGRTKPLTILAPQAIAEYLAAVRATTELRLSYDINFIAIEDLNTQSGYQPLTMQLTESDALTIDVIALSHRTASYAFKLTQVISQTALMTDKLMAMGVVEKRLWGKLQHGIDVALADGSTLYSTDFVTQHNHKTVIIVAGDNDAPQRLSDAIFDANVLVHESTYTQAIVDKRIASGSTYDPKHSSAKQVAEFAQASGLPNLILTHFSARFQPFDNPASKNLSMADIREEVLAHYQGNFWLANDFDEFEVDNGSIKQCL